jgi:DNA replication and repair protein RecF
MRVTAVEARPLRSLEGFAGPLEPGVTSVVGPNGSGKTNLLEALHFALTGRSFRTADRRELIPFGSDLARARATVLDADGAEHELIAAVSRKEGRRHLLDGEPAAPTTIARHRPLTTVFAPDRLVLIKGPPAERRAALDSFVAARWPARSELRKSYGRALAQRNALIAQLASGAVRSDALASWDATFAAAAAALIAARRAAVDELARPFAAFAKSLGIEGEASLDYAPRAEGDAVAIAHGLAERTATDLKLGRSSWGPHLDELRIACDGRPLRRYGSQGQQRLVLLALLFAERAALRAGGSPLPLLLLDDVMSELDEQRREMLAAQFDDGGQVLLTATEDAHLPSAVRRAVIRMPSGETGSLRAVA